MKKLMQGYRANDTQSRDGEQNPRNCDSLSVNIDTYMAPLKARLSSECSYSSPVK